MESSQHLGREDLLLVFNSECYRLVLTERCRTEGRGFHPRWSAGSRSKCPPPLEPGVKVSECNIVLSLANLESQLLDRWFSVGDSLEGVVVLSKLVVHPFSLYFALERKY